MDGQGYSFQSSNYPTRYIRHYNFGVYIASDSGSSAWDHHAGADDVSFLVTQPWGAAALE
jgi:non-reducing end alpha-L-arabinofuranosidase